MLDFHALVAAATAGGPAGGTAGGPAGASAAGPAGDTVFHEATGRVPEVPADLAPAAGVRRLSGRRMTDLGGVYDEASAALQFPEYFGRNLDAFDECLRDLDLPESPGGAVVIVVTEAESMLTDAPGRREWFAEAVDDANEIRSERGRGGVVVVFTTHTDTPADQRWWRGETLGGRAVRTWDDGHHV